MLRPLYLRERSPVLMVQEATWAPGLIWTGAENCGQIHTNIKREYVQFSFVMAMA
jgi:hypothetical protein